MIIRVEIQIFVPVPHQIVETIHRHNIVRHLCKDFLNRITLIGVTRYDLSDVIREYHTDGSGDRQIINRDLAGECVRCPADKGRIIRCKEIRITVLFKCGVVYPDGTGTIIVISTGLAFQHGILRLRLRNSRSFRILLTGFCFGLALVFNGSINRTGLLQYPFRICVIVCDTQEYIFAGLISYCVIDLVQFFGNIEHELIPQLFDMVLDDLHGTGTVRSGGQGQQRHFVSKISASGIHLDGSILGQVGEVQCSVASNLFQLRIKCHFFQQRFQHSLSVDLRFLFSASSRCQQKQHRHNQQKLANKNVFHVNFLLGATYFVFCYVDARNLQKVTAEKINKMIFRLSPFSGLDRLCKQEHIEYDS